MDISFNRRLEVQLYLTVVFDKNNVRDTGIINGYNVHIQRVKGHIRCWKSSTKLP